MGGPRSSEQHGLFLEGARLSLRIFDFPRPVVIGCSGHALALGAIMLLAADYRVGRRGPKFKIGLNEVAIGMTAPVFAIELARNKVRHAADPHDAFSFSFNDFCLVCTGGLVRCRYCETILAGF